LISIGSRAKRSMTTDANATGACSPPHLKYGRKRRVRLIAYPICFGRSDAGDDDSMKTPEGTVKDDIKVVLDARGTDLYYFMPVQQGYGKRGLDFFVCYKGMFIGIECKRSGARAKRFQEDLIETIRDAHGHALVTDDARDVENLLDYIDRSF
jgi:hypothetical protein